jgi:C1A family cysteine protease
MINRKFGWKKDKLDSRDLICMAVRPPIASLVDLRPALPPVFDQGSIGSCVGNGVACISQYVNMIQKQLTANDFLSRLFLYYNGRVIEHTTNEDSGLSIRDGIKSLVKYGACSEKVWPYIESKMYDKPSDEAYAQGKLEQALVYKRVSQNINAMTASLAEGFPIVFGAMLYDSFNRVTKSGFVVMPTKNENELGGHCMVIVGYDRSKAHFIVRNSWGEKWGSKGYCYIPYTYLLNPDLASDFWTVRKME